MTQNLHHFGLGARKIEIDFGSDYVLPKFEPLTPILVKG